MVLGKLENDAQGMEFLEFLSKFWQIPGSNIKIEEYQESMVEK